MRCDRLLAPSSLALVLATLSSPVVMLQKGAISLELCEAQIAAQVTASSTALVQTSTQVDRKAKADCLFKLGLQKVKDIEDLRSSSRRVLIDVDNQSFKDDEARYRYIRTRTTYIDTQIKQVQAEIEKTWLQALKIYRDPSFRVAFPLESHQGEQKIVTKLIEIDFDDRLGREKANQIFQPQEVRALVQQALESYRDPSFRAAFPLESRQDEQSLVIRLMAPSPNRFPAIIVNEKIFQPQEILALVQKALESHRDPSFRAAFPLESRQGEQNILTVLSPSSRAIYQQRDLLQPQGRLQLWRQLLESYRDPSLRAAFPIESRQGEGNALAKLGYIYLFEIGQSEQALNFYKQGLSLAYEAGDRLLALETLGHIISVYWTLEEYQQVIKASEQASTLFQDIYNRIKDGSDLIINKKLSESDPRDLQLILKDLQRIEGVFPDQIGTAYLALGEPQQAIKFYQQFLVISRDRLPSYQRTPMLLNLGVAYWIAGQYEQAVKIYTQIHDSGFSYYPLDYPLIMAGRGYDHLAQYQQAIDLYKQALANARKDTDSYSKQIVALYNLGRIYTSLGQYQQAIETYEQSLALAKQPDVPKSVDWKGIILADLGRVYLSLGKQQQAVDLFEQSLPLIRQVIREKIIDNTGKDYDASQIGRTISERVLLRHWEGVLLSDLGVAYAGLKQHPVALDFLKQSLTTAREIGDRATQSKVLGNLGDVYVESGQYQQAIESYQQALAIAQKSGLREEEGLLFGNIGRLLAQQNQPETAIVFYKQSVNVRESIRKDIRKLPRESQEAYAQSVAGTYRALADLLLSQGRVLEAQQVLELLKIQELRDFSRDTRAGGDTNGSSLTPREAPIPPAFSDKIALGQKLTVCESQTPRCPERESLQAQLKVANNTFNQLADRLRTQQTTKDPAQLLRDELTLAAQKVVLAQPKTVLIYPLVLEDKLWLVWGTQAGIKGVVFDSKEIPVSRKELSATVVRFRQLLERPGDVTEFQQVSQKLYQWLIAPILPQLDANGIQNLVFSLDRATRYIPMSALYDGQHYLVEKFAISTILTAGTTDTSDKLAANSANTKVLGMGLSNAVTGFNPLPNVVDELNGIIRTQPSERGGIFPGSKFLNQTFDRRAFNNLIDYRILHIATHGKFVPGQPEDSFLVLGNGDPLRIPEIKSMTDLNAIHLVVLSACETAKGGEDKEGLEVSGISYYFITSGAKAVIASLWLVNDASTSLLMQQFYQNLPKGMSKTEALRQVQLQFIQGKLTAKDASKRADVEVRVDSTVQAKRQSANFSHPYYWAPFILIGNGL